MKGRRRRERLAAVGMLGWPVGYFGFGGFDTDAGAAIIGGGSLLWLVMTTVNVVQYLRNGDSHGEHDAPGKAG